MICIYVFFSSLFRFMFGLKRISQTHNMTIKFSFFLFIHFFSLFFVNCLFWTTSHVVDGLLAWSIFSYVRIILKRGRLLVQGLFTSFLSKKRVWLESVPFMSARKGVMVWRVLEKWVIFDQRAPRHQSRWFQSITILGFIFFGRWKGLADLKL